MPKQSTDLAELELSGWDEIRKALEDVEDLRRKGVDARVEVVDCRDPSGLRIVLRSFKELQEYISHRFSRMLLNGITSSIPLDDFEQLVAETSTHLLQESHNIRGRIRDH